MRSAKKPETESTPWRVIMAGAWGSPPAQDSERMKSNCHSALAGWARCIAPPIRNSAAA